MMHRNRDEMPQEDDGAASGSGGGSGGVEGDGDGDGDGGGIEDPIEASNSNNDSMNGSTTTEITGGSNLAITYSNGSNSDSENGSKIPMTYHGKVKKMKTEAGEVVMVDMENGLDPEKDEREDNQPCFPGEYYKGDNERQFI